MRQRGALGITENQGVRIAFHLQTAEVADFVSSDLSSPLAGLFCLFYWGLLFEGHHITEIVASFYVTNFNIS